MKKFLILFVSGLLFAQWEPQLDATILIDGYSYDEIGQISAGNFVWRFA